MERSTPQLLLVFVGLLLCGVLNPPPTTAQPFATASSMEPNDESIRERLILFPTDQLNKSNLQYHEELYPDTQGHYLRNLKMGMSKKSMAKKHHKHRHPYHYHHKPQMANTGAMKGGGYKGKDWYYAMMHKHKIPTSGGTFVYAMKRKMWKGHNMWKMMYKGKGWNQWEGKGYKGKGYWKPPKPLPPAMPFPQTSPFPPTPRPTSLVGTRAENAGDEVGCSQCRTGCLSLTDFVMVDADQPVNVDNPDDDYLFPIQEGAAYSLTNMQEAFGVTNFAIVCVTSPEPFAQAPFQIGSVGLRDNFYRTHVGTTGYNAGKDFKGETSPPYVLADNDGETYKATDLTLGENWSITCQAFCGAGLSGDESPAVTRNFQIIPDVPTTPNAP